MSKEATFAMPQPTEWQGLLQTSQDLLQDGSLDDQARLTRLCERIGELDNNRLAWNRFYAVGLPICEFAQIAMEPATRQAIIERRVSHIVGSHDYYCKSLGYKPSDGLRLHELTEKAAENDPDAIAAVDRLQPAVRLLGEALYGVFQVRALDEHYKRKNIRPRKEPPLERAVTRALRMDELSRAVGQYLVSASGVSVVALENMYRTSHGLPIPDSYGARNKQHINPLLADVLDAALEGRPATQLGQALAAVRLDELQHMSDFVTVDDVGMTRLDRRKLPKTPGPIAEPAGDGIRTLHEDRIGCPAMYVQGLIRLVMGMIPEVATGVQREVAKRYPPGKSSFF